MLHGSVSRAHLSSWQALAECCSHGTKPHSPGSKTRAVLLQAVHRGGGCGQRLCRSAKQVAVCIASAADANAVLDGTGLCHRIWPSAVVAKACKARGRTASTRRPHQGVSDAINYKQAARCRCGLSPPLPSFRDLVPRCAWPVVRLVTSARTCHQDMCIYAAHPWQVKTDLSVLLHKL